MGEGVYVGEHLSLHRVWKTPVGKLWSPTGLGKSDRPGVCPVKADIVSGR